ncbi:MAG TPA: cytochrome c-type biogenesis protein CcmH [Acidimicrobiales bacterium]
MTGGVGRLRLAGWLVMAVVLAVALVGGLRADGGPESPEQRARDLAAQVACPACDGQSVADSDAPASRGIRSYIDERIDEGASDEQIRAELADSWGEEVLLTPKSSGVVGLVWILPVVGVVLGLAGVGYAFWRWRGGGASRATPADRELVRVALGDGGGHGGAAGERV